MTASSRILAVYLLTQLIMIKSGVAELRDGNIMGATFSKAKAQGKGKGTPLVFTWERMRC